MLHINYELFLYNHHGSNKYLMIQNMEGNIRIQLNCVIHSFVTLILLVLEIHILTISISAPHVNSIGAARHLPKHSKGQGNMFVLQSLLVVLVQVPPSVFCSIIFRHRTSHWQVLLRLVALCQA